jgi:RNA polymerase sigma factor (sigma-70 family)
MSDRPLRELIRSLREVAGPNEAADLTDAELLRRWVARRDAAAFEVLLWRHGPTVLGLCRRLLRDGHAAEDAFQATFLTLARKAGSISRSEAAGAWLYKVAYRAALRVRAERWRWQPLDPEVPNPAAADPADTAGQHDLREALDAELDRLPARYRTPLILCYFEGRTNEEAAREMGCPVGTVVSRLARGRQRLRGRLIRRGLAPAVVLLAGALPRETAALPPALVATTARAVLANAPRDVVSAQVLALTEGVLRTMSMAKIKIVAAVLMAATVAGAGALGYQQAGPGAATDQPGKLRPLTDQPPGDRAAVPLKPPAASKARPVDPQDLRDAVEQAQANLNIKKAELQQAQAAMQFANAQLARFKQLSKTGAIDARLIEEKEADAAAKRATVQIKEAELKLAEVQLTQAKRRLIAAEPPSLPKRSDQSSAEQRLRELEQRFDKLRRDFDELKRQLQQKKGA